MVEFGVTYKAVVATFDRQIQSGTLRVIDYGGEPTGEQLEFHFCDGVYPFYSLWGYVEFGRERERDCQRLRYPAPGDLIICRKLWQDTDDPTWIRLEWTFGELWSEEQRKLSLLHEWRLVRRYERLRPETFPAFELVRKDILIFGGKETLEKIHRFGPERLLLYKEDTDRAEAAIDPDGSFFYQIEAKKPFGDWEELSLIQPNDTLRVVG